MHSLVKLQIRGLNLDRLPDALQRRGIDVFNVCKESKKSMLLCVRAADGKKAAALLSEREYECEVLAQTGAYGFFRVVKNNLIIACAVVAALFMCLYLNTLCWGVSVDAGGLVSADRVEELLLIKGIRRGCNKSRIVFDELENYLTNAIDGAEYTFLAFRGNSLVVKITARATVSPEVDYSKPNDIIAARDGVVTRIVVLKGTKRVSVGDSVTAGQTLIEGVAEYSNGTTAQVCAQGEVFLEICAQGEAAYCPSVAVYAPTGRSVRITAFTVLGHGVDSLRRIPYADYSVSISEHILSPLPVRLQIITVYEYKIDIINKTFPEQLDELKSIAYNNAVQGAEFAVERHEYIIHDDKVTAMLYGEVSGGRYKTAA